MEQKRRTESGAGGDVKPPRNATEQAFWDSALIAIMAAICNGDGSWSNNAEAAAHGADALLDARRVAIAKAKQNAAP